MAFLGWLNPTPISAWPFSWSNQIQSIGKVPTSDSDLPDAVIIEECQTTMQEAYAQREFEGPLCAQSNEKGTTDIDNVDGNLWKFIDFHMEIYGNRLEFIEIC